MPDPAPKPADHFCANSNRCTDTIDNHPRETEAPNTLCPKCLQQSRRHINELPTQWRQLRAMTGDKHAGIDVGIHQKPASTVPLNLHVDTLLGAILDTVTTAADILADKLGMRETNGDPWYLPHTPNLDTHGRIIGYLRRPPHEQVQTGCRIIGPNIATLADIRGVGGRPAHDPVIDVMFWNKSGTLHGFRATTGLQLVCQLDKLADLAHFTLGQTRARTHRDIPCTRCHAKAIGRWAGSDQLRLHRLRGAVRRRRHPPPGPHTHRTAPPRHAACRLRFGPGVRTIASSDGPVSPTCSGIGSSTKRPPPPPNWTR